MIKIVVVSYNGQAPAEPMSALFGQEAKTLGRSEDNFFVLPDPKHLVSRRQAAIASDGLHHTITSLSHANPVVLNGRELDAGVQHDLVPADEIQVGLYVLRAELHLTAVSGRGVTEPIGNAPRNPAVVVRTDDENRGIAEIRSRPVDIPVTLAAAMELPSIPFRAELAVSVTHNPAKGCHSLEIVGEGSNPTISETESRAGVAALIDVPDANEDHAATHSARYEPPAIADEDVVPSTLLSVIDAQAQVDAFLRGAGIPTVTLSTGLTPELMELIGKVLATAIQGTIDLNALRSLVKREVRADVTMVVVKNNNPLKFFPDSQTVLTQMLRKKMPGFMAPVEAMEDAYEDLQAHQLGIISGMRASIGDLLGRIDPAVLAKEQGAATFFESLNSSSRKAKCWDAYSEVFKRLDKEVKDDSQTRFGKVFLDAYEVEVERFKDGNHDG